MLEVCVDMRTEIDKDLLIKLLTRRLAKLEVRKFSDKCGIKALRVEHGKFRRETYATITDIEVDRVDRMERTNLIASFNVKWHNFAHHPLVHNQMLDLQTDLEELLGKLG